MALSFDAEFYETSAVTGFNVQAAFLGLATSIYNKMGMVRRSALLLYALCVFQSVLYI